MLETKSTFFRVNYRLLPFLIILSTLISCARQSTPQGGPADKTPPKLVSSNPANNQKNFQGRVITLTFSEAVKLNNPKEEIIVAPAVGKETMFTAKQNRVTIDFKKPLRDSTTYSITFREGIQDLTEGNPADNLHLAFSTGTVIDSLKINGTISDAISEKIPEKITVAIYQADTFDIFKHTPEYFTRADKEGRFVITNLKPGKYRIYAFEDKNKNLKLESRSERFGFIPGYVHPGLVSDSIQIPLIALDVRKPRLTSVRPTETYGRAKLNKQITNFTSTTNSPNIITAFGDDQSEIRYYFFQPDTDSILTTLHGIDSLTQTIDTTFYVKTGKGSPLKDKFTVDLTDIQVNTESGIATATIAFTKPLRTLNLDSVFIKLDSVNSIPFTPSDLLYDTTHNKIRISKKLDSHLLADPPKQTELYIGPSSLVSIEYDSSKRISKPITIAREDETATLFLEVQTKQPEYVIQLLSADNKVVRTSRNQPKIIFKNIPPTDYKIRILIDTNHNDRWDPGNINKDIPPEKVYFFKNVDGKYSFPVRANWQVGPYTVSF